MTSTPSETPPLAPSSDKMTKAMASLMLDTVERNQEAILETVRLGLPTPGARLRLPETASKDTAEARLAEAFDFAEKLLVKQREFAEGLLEAFYTANSAANATQVNTAKR